MAGAIYDVSSCGTMWRISLRGSAVGHVYQKKQDAIDTAGNWAKAKPPSQVIVHTADGKIETEWTYDNDPYPPPG